MNDDIEAALERLPGWTLVDGAIEKTFDFSSYARTLAFVNAVAAIAERMDHHPDIDFGYRRCTVRYRTHSANAVTRLDLDAAARVDALLA